MLRMLQIKLKAIAFMSLIMLSLILGMYSLVLSLLV